MPPDRPDWEYWAIDLPGLSQAHADELLGMAEDAGMSFGGSTVDPLHFLSLHFDRVTVESLYRALSSITGDDKVRDTSSVCQRLKEWLDHIPGEEP